MVKSREEILHTGKEMSQGGKGRKELSEVCDRRRRDESSANMTVNPDTVTSLHPHIVRSNK